MGNPMSFLSTMKKRWKSASSVKTHFSILLGKTFMEKFFSIDSLQKRFGGRNLYGSCLSVHERHFKVIGRMLKLFSPLWSQSKTILFKENIKNVISRTKNALKMISRKGQHNDFKSSEGITKLTDFREEEPWKSILQRNRPWKSISGKRNPVQATYPQKEFQFQEN